MPRQILADMFRFESCGMAADWQMALLSLVVYGGYFSNHAVDALLKEGDRFLRNF